MDAELRRRNAVFEYTSNPACIFRLQINRAMQDFAMSDSSHLQPNSRVADLHFWSEQIPPLPGGRPTIGWARGMHARIDESLDELRQYLDSRADLADVSAVRASMAQAVNARSHKLCHIMQKFGFETGLEEVSVSLGEGIHRFGENILISMMVLAQNSSALHLASLWRGRLTMILPRARLEERYPSRLSADIPRPVEIVSARAPAGDLTSPA